MSEIGLLIKSKLNEPTVLFRGYLKTLEHTLRDFELVKNPTKQTVDDEGRPITSSHPDYLIFIINKDNERVKIGAGWHRQYTRNGQGGEMVSMTFDDPSFEYPLHVTAFPPSSEGDPNHWPISWRRRAQSAA